MNNKSNQSRSASKNQQLSYQATSHLSNKNITLPSHPYNDTQPLSQGQSHYQEPHSQPSAKADNSSSPPGKQQTAYPNLNHPQNQARRSDSLYNQDSSHKIQVGGASVKSQSKQPQGPHSIQAQYNTESGVRTGFQRINQLMNQTVINPSHSNSMNQTMKDSSYGFYNGGSQTATLHSLNEGCSTSGSSSQLRVKMLKRYSLKSKAANVLQRIGFPQKKFKIQEDLKKIKKEIGARMDGDNQEFFDLLNATSQSFFEQMNETAAYSTFYGAQNPEANDYGYPEATIESNNQSDFIRDGKRSQKLTGSAQRPTTELNNRMSFLQPPSNALAAGRDLTSDSRNQLNISRNLNSSTSKNLSFLNPQPSSKLRTTALKLNNSSNIRPQTSSNTNQVSMSQFTNQRLHNLTQLQKQMNSKAAIESSKTQSTKLTFNSSNLLIDNTVIDSVVTTTMGGQKARQLMNQTASDFRRHANTTLESQNFKGVSNFEESQKNLSNNISRIDNRLFQTPLTLKTDVEQQSFGLRERGDSNERSAFFNQTSDMGADSFFLLQQLDRKPLANQSRASFKRSREQAQPSHLSAIEKEFEAIRFAFSGSENLLRIKNLIVQSYDVISLQGLPFESRKQSLVGLWSKLIAEIKLSDELSTGFDLLFWTQKALGDVLMDFKDLGEAVRVYKSLKVLCEDFQRYKEKMFVYQQIGYVCRIMKDNESAAKQFKKQLQLAWQEGDTQMEVNAYDNLSLEYFYLGELGKAHYYNDRIMRGKTENNKSIVKKVSCNLLVSRREHRHNLELRKAGEKRKGAAEQQRLPSPSAINKGTQFSKAINLLPNYTESQALGIKEEDDDEETGLTANVHEKKKKKAQSQERRFTQKELLHLNKPPPYEYLKPRKDKKLLSSKSFVSKTAANSAAGYESHGVFRQEDPVDYKPFDEDRFRDIVTYALQKKETSHTTDDKRNLSHLSVHRTAPLSVMHPSKMIESLKKVIQDYVARLVQMALQDKLLRSKEYQAKRDQQPQT